MTSGRDDRYVRLLRWYPKAWRDAHGTVFVDTLREQSEHEGRTRPSRSESFAAMVNGLGTRMDAQLASRLALAGIALTAASKSVILQLQGLAGFPWDALIAVDFGATAVLVLTGVAALARAHGLVTPARAICVLALAWPACILAAFAQYAPMLGFNAAEAGVEVTGPGVYTVGFAGPATAWVTASAVAGGALAAVAAWFMAEGVLRRTRLRRLPRFGLATVAAVVAAPAVAVAVVSPMGWVAVALGVVVLFMRLLGTADLPEPSPAGGSRSRWVRPLTAVSATLGGLGIAYALTASAWSPAATNGEAALRQGALILMVASTPLVATLGILAAGRGRPPLHVWGPVTLLIVGIGISILAFRHGLGLGSSDPAVLTGSAVLGAGIGWWAAAPLRASRRERWVAGASVALACLAFEGAYVLAYAVFVAPILAVVLVIRGDLGRRRTAFSTNDPIASA